MVSADFFTHIGHKKCIYQSDGEYPLLALKGDVCDRVEGKTLLMHESPVGEHQANGSAENAVKGDQGYREDVDHLGSAEVEASLAVRSPADPVGTDVCSADGE